MVKALFRWFGYLFHLSLGLFLLVVALLAMGSGPHAPRMEMLPWSGQTLNYVLLAAALLGLSAVLLALTGKLPLALFAWSLVVAVVLLKSYVFSSYRFGPGEAKNAMELVAASWLAVPGAWFALRRQARGSY